MILDTSSDDEPSRTTSHKNQHQYYDKEDTHTSFAQSSRKRQFYQEDDVQSTQPRTTVIVSPSINTTGGFSFNATSSSQDSGSSGDEYLDGDDIHPVHKKFIKPKKMAAPVIDQKAKNMMVVALKS